MASEQLGRPILGHPTQPPPSQQPETGVGIEKSSTTAAGESPLEFRGIDFFAKHDINQFKTASKAYFTPTTSGKRFSFNPSSWLGDATPPGSPAPSSTEGSFAAAGRFPIPPDGKTPRPERKILGLRRPWFWTLLAIGIVLVIVAIGVGAGVGARNRSSYGGSKEAASSSSPTPAGSDASATTSGPTTATITETSTATATPTAGAMIDCPAANGTTYQVPGSDKQFLRICGIDYSGDGATDIRHVYTEDALDCMKNCAGTADCTGCGWGYIEGDVGTQHACWMKTNLKTSRDVDENWAFAVLL